MPPHSAASRGCCRLRLGLRGRPAWLCVVWGPAWSVYVVGLAVLGVGLFVRFSSGLVALVRRLWFPLRPFLRCRPPAPGVRASSRLPCLSPVPSLCCRAAAGPPCGGRPGVVAVQLVVVRRRRPPRSRRAFSPATTARYRPWGSAVLSGFAVRWVVAVRLLRARGAGCGVTCWSARRGRAPGGRCGVVGPRRAGRSRRPRSVTVAAGSAGWACPLRPRRVILRPGGRAAVAPRRWVICVRVPLRATRPPPRSAVSGR